MSMFEKDVDIILGQKKIILYDNTNEALHSSFIIKRHKRCIRCDFWKCPQFTTEDAGSLEKCWHKDDEISYLKIKIKVFTQISNFWQKLSFILHNYEWLR